MDEIDAIGGRRFSEGTSADREIQRTLMEVCVCVCVCVCLCVSVSVQMLGKRGCRGGDMMGFKVDCCLVFICVSADAFCCIALCCSCCTSLMGLTRLGR